MESNSNTKQENPYAMRSMDYLEHLLEELSDDYCYLKRAVRDSRKEGEEPSEYTMAQLAGIFSCQDAIQEEIKNRTELGIVNPQGFCDCKNNENGVWNWECSCPECLIEQEEWEYEDDYVNSGPEIGNCGFPCDGHCQECDPGYMDRMRYGSYDHAGEI